MKGARLFHKTLPMSSAFINGIYFGKVLWNGLYVNIFERQLCFGKEPIDKNRRGLALRFSKV